MPSRTQRTPTRSTRDRRPVRDRRPSRRRGLRPLAIVLVAAILLAGLAAATLAWADRKAADRLAGGTLIGGIDVGGMTRPQALDRLSRRIGRPARRSVTVRVDGTSYRLSAEQAGVHVQLGRAVDQALAEARGGSFIERGWRELTGKPVAIRAATPIAHDPAAVKRFVSSIHRAVARRPQDATMTMTVTSVSVTPGKEGRALAGREALERRIATALDRPHSARSFTAHITTIEPQHTAEQLWAAQPVAVTVSRSGTRVRVFDHGRVVTTYTVAVGSKQYPTPEGRFTVQSMQKNPAWNVPDSEWAGDLAGKTIPGGDPKNPLVARWIGFNGSVGFHGTPDVASLGRAASHGCVRMNKADVIDLFKHVEVGTPVLVGA